jgi:hypothetical protein
MRKQRPLRTIVAPNLVCSDGPFSQQVDALHLFDDLHAIRWESPTGPDDDRPTFAAVVDAARASGPTLSARCRAHGVHLEMALAVYALARVPHRYQRVSLAALYDMRPAAIRWPALARECDDDE